VALFLVKTSGLSHVDVEEAARLVRGRVRDVMAAEQIGKNSLGRNLMLTAC
jgi:hypothetical protein